MNYELPLYARIAAIVGRPVVLVAALAMSAPGEYALAVSAGWSPDIAWLMPVSLSVYAAVAAVIAATRPKGVAGRVSALIGAGIALALALAAQVVAHLIASGYMTGSAILVAATSAVPPLTVAHMLHLAAVPRTAVQRAADNAPHLVAVEPLNAAHVAAESLPAVADNWPPDDLWVDFEDSAPDVAESVADKPPVTADVVHSAVSALTAKGVRVTGRALADHFGVSERTGRRYLAMAA
jgi:MFS family permease